MFFSSLMFVQACGIPTVRRPGIMCYMTFNPVEIILPQCDSYGYEGIGGDVEEAPRDTGEYFLGFLQHIKSGRYVYPDGGYGAHTSRLLLGPPVPDPAFVFRFHKDGSFEHDQSELFVHPDKGAAEPGNYLILHEGGHVRR